MDLWVFTHPFFYGIAYHSLEVLERTCMYLLTVKDGLVTRFVGPYDTPQNASDDLSRVLSGCSERARWQIHALESPNLVSLSQRFSARDDIFSATA